MPAEPEGTAPAIITDHPFVPRLQWWTRCLWCDLAEAAHAESAICQACGEPVGDDRFGEPLCVDCDLDARP